MNYLFIHQNFPGQYRHIVADLARDPDNQVRFISQPNEAELPGVHKVTYLPDSRRQLGGHAWTAEFNRAVHTGASVADVCRGLEAQGFRPDLVVGHGGWGETLFVKDALPGVPVLANFEFYYHTRGVDVDFDPEFQSTFHTPSQLRVRNSTALLNFQCVDWGHSATRWQRSLHPREMQARISVLHEGVDTALARPDPRARFQLPGGRTLTAKDEVLTYVARNLEPYRGFHTFMRCLPVLLKRRRRAHVVIAGSDGVSYGAPAAPRSTWREWILQELEGKLDLARVHFVGRLEHADYLRLLQVSSAHVYLTYPFVLSWSFIEALASGCVVLGSATAPVMEVLRDGVNGVAVDFFDHEGLAARLAEVLASPGDYRRLRAAARATAVEHFDLRTRALPRWHRLFADLIKGRKPRLGV